MKILAIADEEVMSLWDNYVPGRLKPYDLILSCGDLHAAYLSFLVTMGRAPVLYVHGNHDVTFDQNPPEGCDCIDGKIVVCKGLRILGLGGCMRYRPGAHQYSDREMEKRIKKLTRDIKALGGVDIVVTHAAPEGLGDDEDRAHWGFPALVDLMDKYKPKFLVHGHVHMSYGHNIPREIDYNGTRVINAYERYTIEISEGNYKLKDWNQVIYKTRPPREDTSLVLI